MLIVKIIEWLIENLSKLVRICQRHPKSAFTTCAFILLYLLLEMYVLYQPFLAIYGYIGAVDERNWDEARSYLTRRLKVAWSKDEMIEQYRGAKAHNRPNVDATEDRPNFIKAWLRKDLYYSLKVDYQVLLRADDLATQEARQRNRENILWAQLRSPDEYNKLSEGKVSGPITFTIQSVRTFKMVRCGILSKIDEFATRVSDTLVY
jgi:hypothetical protein